MNKRIVVSLLLLMPSSFYGMNSRTRDLEDFVLEEEGGIQSDLQGMRKEARAPKTVFSKHVLEQIRDRGISRGEVESAVKKGKKTRAKDGSWKYRTNQKNPLTVVVAENDKATVIVTAYRKNSLEKVREKAEREKKKAERAEKAKNKGKALEAAGELNASAE